MGQLHYLPGSSRAALDNTLISRELIPRDILSECSPGSPAVLITLQSEHAIVLCERLKRVLRKTDLIHIRNGIVTIFALIRNRDDIPLVTTKVDRVLSELELTLLVSVTYLDL